MKHIVVFSGAGMSAESGLKTFRDNGGLWENYKVEDVATPQAWAKDPEMVLHFYNLRRTQLFKAKPNQAHFSIAELEKKYKISVITQNIDDLHERAGSTNVIHLHGELKKVRSERHTDLIYQWDKEELHLGENCELGFQLRPHVVWFGEEVPMMELAFRVSQTADILIVVGTSLNVYPAANVVNFVPDNCINYLIDPKPPIYNTVSNFSILKAGAEEGMRILSQKLNA
ncbi:MAG: NAD-dependent deacylase [Flavobacteriales bacterium]|nr:NAD-dependent deacylase [Flavobacteriales bacterium]